VISALLAMETSSLRALAEAIDRKELETPTALNLQYYCPTSQVQALSDQIKAPDQGANQCGAKHPGEDPGRGSRTPGCPGGWG
jgi:hypothetical protein